MAYLTDTAKSAVAVEWRSVFPSSNERFAPNQAPPGYALTDNRRATVPSLPFQHEPTAPAPRPRNNTQPTVNLPSSSDLSTTPHPDESTAVALLSAAGFSPDKLPRDRNAALLWAAEAGSASTVSYCLTRWPDRAPRRRLGLTPPRRLSRIDTTTAGLAFSQNEHKLDALHIAAQHGHVDVLEVLLGNGEGEGNVPVDLESEIWGTALHLAAQNGHVEAVGALLDAGADPDRLTATKRQSALQLAAEKGSGNNAVVRLLLERGAKPNLGRNHRALHSASELGDFNAAQMLVNAGAEVDAVNNGLRTALQLAARDGHTAVAYLLLSHGAKVDMRDDTRRMTALDHAARNGHVEVVRVLLAAGTWAEAKLGRDALGFTPLHAAAMNGHVEVVRVLLGCGVDRSVKNKKGRTAGELAREEGFEEVGRVLEGAAGYSGGQAAGGLEARDVGEELPAYGEWSQSANVIEPIVARS